MTTMSPQGVWFPSKRLADKFAALEAVKKLDQAGELDRHLKPIVRSDESDSEVQQGEGEGEGPAEGPSKVNMDRKACHYRNKVGHCVLLTYITSHQWPHHFAIFSTSFTHNDKTHH